MALLIGYDGSADARCAIEHAGPLFPGRAAVVLTVWEGFAEILARSGGGSAIPSMDFIQVDDASQRSALERADEGCALARDAGLDAEPLIAQRELTVWDTIVGEAARVDADAIVLGNRGLTGVKSMLLGSVSRGVLQHADRPVLVVPAAEVARERSERRDNDA
ncbi:MAG: universal stress protein [Solirubrobacteraceae bacterium]